MVSVECAVTYRSNPVARREWNDVPTIPSYRTRRSSWYSPPSCGSGPRSRGRRRASPRPESRRLAALHRGHARATSYSPLDQINAANFSKLEVAWRFKTDNLGPRPEYKLEGTPLAINGDALHDRRHAPLGRRARRQDRRADLGAQPARRAGAPASRRASCRAAACSYWTDGKGDERDPLRDDRLSPGRAQREDRRADQLVRQGRRRRSEGRRRVRQRPADRSRDRRDRPALRRRPSSRTS